MRTQSPASRLGDSNNHGQQALCLYQHQHQERRLQKNQSSFAAGSRDTNIMRERSKADARYWRRAWKKLAKSSEYWTEETDKASWVGIVAHSALKLVCRRSVGFVTMLADKYWVKLSRILTEVRVECVPRFRGCAHVEYPSLLAKYMYGNMRRWSDNVEYCGNAQEV